VPERRRHQGDRRTVVDRQGPDRLPARHHVYAEGLRTARVGSTDGILVPSDRKAATTNVEELTRLVADL
jgi:hypothetical protein